MKMNPVSLLRSIYRKRSEVRNVNRLRRYILGCSLPAMQKISLSSLTKQEYRAIESIWGKIGLKPYSHFYQLFKTIDHFDPLYLSDDLYYPVIVQALNPKRYIYAFSHKGHFPVLFGGIRQPALVALSNGGIIFNSDFDIISGADAIELLQQRKMFIIKPTVNTSGGKGVKLVNDVSDEDVQSLLREYGDNWIAQEIVEQSAETAQFNDTSLNTFRITTLFINGRVTTQSIIFKTGSTGSVVDNLSSGGVLIGVSKDGELRNFGINNEFCKCDKTASGMTLNGVGWDVALDISGQPIVIEANLINPGILFEQLAITTPIFGERTEEVVQYVVNRKLR